MVYSLTQGIALESKGKNQKNCIWPLEKGIDDIISQSAANVVA